MKTLQTAGLMLVLTGLMAIPAQADIALFESGLNVDGTISDPGSPPAIVPCDVDGAGCVGILPGSVVDGRAGTGLGTFSLSIMGAGDHYVGFYADFEIAESVNTFFNEVGAVLGAPGAGQSWEMDEPGFGGIIGDIAGNFVGAMLDGTNSVGAGCCGGSGEDVAMALAWDFTLAPDEEAVIEFIFGTVAPAGFSLHHHDPDVAPGTGDIYFSSTLAIGPTGPNGQVPEPSSLLLLAGGLIGGLAYARRKSA